MTQEPDTKLGPTFDGVKLCRENIERLKAYKASAPPAPRQRDYNAKPLTVGLPGVPSKRSLKRAGRAAKYEAKYGRRAAAAQVPVFPPVRMTSTAPYPDSSLV